MQRLYARVRDHIKDTGDHSRWAAEEHPRDDAVATWIAAGELYVAEATNPPEGAPRIAGAVVANHEAADGYDEAPWSVPVVSEQALILHVLGIDPGYMRRGVARYLLDRMAEIGRENGLRAVRLDTFVTNTPARALYERHGWIDVGTHSLKYPGLDLEEFRLFELPL